MNDSYQAGYCNIGVEEKRLRRRTGYLGIVLTVLGLIISIGLNLDPIFNLLLFLPIYVTVIGFYQDKNNFCVYFGFSGQYSMAEDTRDIERVSDKIKKKLDRNRAIKMSVIATGVSGIIAFGFYLVTFLIAL